MPNIPTHSTPQVVNNNVPQNIPLEFHRVSIGANGLEIYEKGVAPKGAPKKVKFVSGNNRHLC